MSKRAKSTDAQVAGAGRWSVPVIYFSGSSNEFYAQTLMGEDKWTTQPFAKKTDAINAASYMAAALGRSVEFRSTGET